MVEKIAFKAATSYYNNKVNRKQQKCVYSKSRSLIPRNMCNQKISFKNIRNNVKYDAMIYDVLQRETKLYVFSIFLFHRHYQLERETIQVY